MKIKLLSPEAKAPARATDEAAGYDLYVPQDYVVCPGRNIVPLKIAMSLSPGQHAHIRPRSGFSAKGMEGHYLDADVIQGTVDSDYRNGVGVIVKSNEAEPFLVTAGTRIAQMIILTHSTEGVDIVDELDDTARGLGGFGSTGTH